jgi:hypothetical protein
MTSEEALYKIGKVGPIKIPTAIGNRLISADVARRREDGYIELTSAGRAYLAVYTVERCKEALRAGRGARRWRKRLTYAERWS